MKQEKIVNNELTDEEIKAVQKYFYITNNVREQLNAGCFRITFEYKDYNITLIVTDKETEPIECLEGENEPVENNSNTYVGEE